MGTTAPERLEGQLPLIRLPGNADSLGLWKQNNGCPRPPIILAPGVLYVLALVLTTVLQCVGDVCAQFGGSAVKNLPANAGDARDTSSVPGSGRSPGGGNATHSSILAWRIPMDRGAWRAIVLGPQRVRHNSTHAVVQSLQVRKLSITRFIILLVTGRARFEPVPVHPKAQALSVSWYWALWEVAMQSREDLI